MPKTMSAQEPFALDLNGTAVRGTLHLPPRDPDDPSTPGVVLLCLGPPSRSDEIPALVDDLRTALLEADVAVAEVDADGSERLASTVDRAAAALHALSVRADLDVHRIGVLGYSLGTITAACLAGRSDQIARLALLAPVSTELLADRLADDDAAAVAADLGAAEVDGDFFAGLEQLEPARDLTRYDRPTLIMHGAADRALPVAASEHYRDALRASGRQAEHLLVGLGNHALGDGAVRRASAVAVARFFAATPNAETTANGT